VGVDDVGKVAGLLASFKGRGDNVGDTRGTLVGCLLVDRDEGEAACGLPPGVCRCGSRFLKLMDSLCSPFGALVGGRLYGVVFEMDAANA
jgi:hypothetical protein